MINSPQLAQVGRTVEKIVWLAVDAVKENFKQVLLHILGWQGIDTLLEEVILILAVGASQHGSGCIAVGVQAQRQVVLGVVLLRATLHHAVAVMRS